MSVRDYCIELTADGSHTLFVPELDEHYHSVNGAIQESKHVFIEAGLTHLQKKDIHIFEVGFGTGLNAYLTLMEVQNNSELNIHYTSIEAFPLSTEVIDKLNYSSDKPELFLKLHGVEWGSYQEICRNFHLKKIEANFIEFDIDDSFDLIYFDAFAPDKQPDMWTQEIFDKLYRKANIGAVLVTYCAKGVVRRMMQQSGFVVERLPGPPGKREMLRAVKC